MARFIPKDIPDEDWEKLTPHKPYAVLCGETDYIFLKVGIGKGFYLGIWPFKGGGRLINSLQYDSGDETLLFKLTHGTKATLGRSLDSEIRIMHSIISRKHIEFSFYKNVLTVKDFSSTNGSYVHKQNIYFSIDDYLEHNPIKEAATRTLDEVHQTFGPDLNDFFKVYLAGKEFERAKPDAAASTEKKEEKKDEPNNSDKNP